MVLSTASKDSHGQFLPQFSKQTGEENRTPKMKEETLESMPTESKAPSQLPGGIKWNEHKAGLAGVDKERVQAIVTQLSKGSRFYEREKEKAKKLAERVESVRREVEAARRSPDVLTARQEEVDSTLLPQLEAQRVCGRVLACVDFDCFFAAVEALDDPSLVGVPHAVGSKTNGVLSTASYEARRYGVRSAMPVFIANKLCPQLRTVPVRMERYKEISQLVRDEVFERFDPGFTMGGLDEGFLDLTHLVNAQRSAADVVSELRAEVQRVTGGLTVSVGCAPNRLLAKICADMNKPDGQTLVLPDGDDSRATAIEFMAELPLRKVPGIGRVLESFLEDGLDIKNVGDLFTHRALIAEVFSERTLCFLLRVALGIGGAFTKRDGDEEWVRKGISCSRTFSPERDDSKLMAKLRQICEMLEQDVRKAGIEGARTVVLKLKTSDFVPISRSATIPLKGMVSTADDFLKYGAKLLKVEMPCELRLIGVGLQKLTFKSECIPVPKNSITKYLHKGTESDESPEKAPADTQHADAGKGCKSVPSSQSLFKSRSFAEKITNKTQRRKPSCAACEGNTEGMNSADAKHVESLLCPVCNSRCFKNLSSLNSHIDECLNVTSDAFKRAVEESGARHTAPTAKKRKL